MTDPRHSPGPDGGAARLLEEARARLRRLDAADAAAAVAEPATVLVDIRTESQRVADGEVPGAIRYSLNHLEWRVDQASGLPDTRFADVERIVVLCDQGYSSSLAAARLLALGVPDATDVIGGFQAWRAAGLPTEAHTGADEGVSSA